jgi:hypothetical protein
MSNKRCTFAKNGHKPCRNPVIDGFNFCKSHLHKLDPVFRYRIPDHILFESSGNGQGFLFDSNLGHVYYLNGTGIYMFSLMKENKPLSEITGAVSRRYGIEDAKVLHDFRDFYDNLKHLGLITSNEEH